MYAIGVAPSAERDIERIHHELEARARAGKASAGYPDQWFEDVMEGIHRLDQFAKRHPYAPERATWGQDVRNVLLSNGYRILYYVREDTAWVLRVRHQRQTQLKAAGPGSAYRSELVIRWALDEAEPDPSSIVALLDSIPGAFERANRGMREIRADEGTPLDEF